MRLAPRRDWKTLLLSLFYPVDAQGARGRLGLGGLRVCKRWRKWKGKMFVRKD